jgi:hypothetical protein
MGHRHSIVRIVIALLAAFVVFWVGVKVGEVKTGYGMGSGRGGFNRGSMMYRGYPPGYAVPVNGVSAPTSVSTSTGR